MSFLAGQKYHLTVPATTTGSSGPEYKKNTKLELVRPVQNRFRGGSAVSVRIVLGAVRLSSPGAIRFASPPRRSRFWTGLGSRSRCKIFSMCGPVTVQNNDAGRLGLDIVHVTLFFLLFNIVTSSTFIALHAEETSAHKVIVLTCNSRLQHSVSKFFRNSSYFGIIFGLFSAKWAGPGQIESDRVKASLSVPVQDILGPKSSSGADLCAPTTPLFWNQN
jgi:hypothetical protein